MSPERLPSVRVETMRERVPAGTRRVKFEAIRIIHTLYIDDIYKGRKIVNEGFSLKRFERRAEKAKAKLEKRGERIKNGDERLTFRGLLDIAVRTGPSYKSR